MINSVNHHLTKNDIRLVWLLVLFSGNPFLSQFQWLNIVFTIGFCIYWIKKPKPRPSLNSLYKYILGVILIFSAQTVVLGWNSFPAIINFCCKIFWGGSVFLILGEKFRYAYLKVMTVLAICSLIFWILSLLHITFPGLPWAKGSTFILYTYNLGPDLNELSVRNCGFPWEPGAFGCYLIITFLLFINSIPSLWHNHKNSCLIILIAILTTMSTTAYITIAILICSYLILRTKSFIKYIWLSLIVVFCLYVGKNVDFLAEKIIEQTDSAMDANGKFNSTRLGSLLFDIYYIDKHPLVGNGLHSKTRYADHQYLVSMWEKGKQAQSGNGFSGIIANMGFLYVFLFIYIFNTQNKRQLQLNDKVLIFIGLVLLLFGEPLLTYPLLLSFPLIKYNYMPEWQNKRIKVKNQNI